MRLLGCPHVDGQVVPAGRIQPLVAEQLLDMSDRAAVEQERRRHCVPENMSADLLPEPSSLGHTLEHVLDGVIAETPGLLAPGHEERLFLVSTAGYVASNPFQRPIRKEEQSLLVPFPDNLRFPSLKVNVDPVKGEDL